MDEKEKKVVVLDKIFFCFFEVMINKDRKTITKNEEKKKKKESARSVERKEEEMIKKVKVN